MPAREPGDEQKTRETSSHSFAATRSASAVKVAQSQTRRSRSFISARASIRPLAQDSEQFKRVVMAIRQRRLQTVESAIGGWGERFCFKKCCKRRGGSTVPVLQIWQITASLLQSLYVFGVGGDVSKGSSGVNSERVQLTDNLTFLILRNPDSPDRNVAVASLGQLGVASEEEEGT